ncbi:MAG: hypothetical protein PHC86_00135 [Eubacteriales bacterium]|nr:hypothetical protein [Eubacteriales bacterium]
MKKIWQRLTASAIILILLTGGCSKVALPDATSDILSPSSNSTQLEATIGNDQFELEQLLLGQIRGGLFFANYGSSYDSKYRSARAQAVETFKQDIIKLVSAEQLASEGFFAYEQFLLSYFDQVNPDATRILQSIAQEILLNRISRSTYLAQISIFQSTSPNNLLLKATLDNAIFDAARALYAQQITYLSWLLGATEVAAQLLGQTNQISSNALLLDASQAFNNFLVGRGIDLVSRYSNIATSYTYLVSADYYFGEHQFDLLTQVFPQKPVLSDGLIDFENMYSDLLKTDRKPANLIDLSTPNFSTYKHMPRSTLFSFLDVSVYAETTSADQSAFALAMMLLAELETLPAQKWREHTIDTLLTEIILLPGLSDSLENLQQQVDPNLRQDFRTKVLQLAEINPLAGSDDQPETLQIHQEIENVSSVPILTDEARTELIQNISNGQSLLEGLYLINEDFAYSQMINQLTEMITDKTNLDPERLQSINQLLNQDLEASLGDRKGELISRLIDTSAEDILDQFNGWRQDTENFQSTQFDHDDLIRLLSRFGLVLAEENNASTSQTDIETTQESDVNQTSEFVEKGYWELIETIEVIPSTHEIGDDSDHRIYTFEYSNGLISCEYERKVYDGIKKSYLTETIATRGGWSLANTDGAFLPGEVVKINLATQIDSFSRLTVVASGGTGTNNSGVSAWAYIGRENTAFGNASSGILESISGESVCRASIIDGEIAIDNATLEVAGSFGPGADEEVKVLFVVISNQGRVGGVKYIYKFAK